MEQECKFIIRLFYQITVEDYQSQWGFNLMLLLTEQDLFLCRNLIVHVLKKTT